MGRILESREKLFYGGAVIDPYTVNPFAQTNTGDNIFVSQEMQIARVQLLNQLLDVLEDLRRNHRKAIRMAGKNTDVRPDATTLQKALDAINARQQSTRLRLFY